MTNNVQIPEYAFILAAGEGTRLRPYTDTMPKPMVPVNGRPLIEYTLDKLKEVGVKHVTINIFYLGDRIKKFVKEYKGLNITISEEESLLNTGGGVKNALDTMGGKPFYLINGDALWEDTKSSALYSLASIWNNLDMDILLLLQPTKNMTLTHGVGDYNINQNNKVVRALNQDGQYMFGGIRIVNPSVFNDAADDAFSFLQLMDEAEKQNRLSAVVHDGEWHHISTPEELDRVNQAFMARAQRKNIA